MEWPEGQVALVTGGASGTGRAVTRRYVQEGARVCVADVDEEKLALIADELGDSITTVVCDVRDIAQNQAAVAHAESTFYDEIFDVNVSPRTEFAPHVRVNAVAPGATRTDMRLPKSLRTTESGERTRARVHPSNAEPEVERVTPLRRRTRRPRSCSSRRGRRARSWPAP
jgi:NAD(P)-dependent dehydrogenase (short-subunit alcohol dehydrogenase family)